MRGATHILAGFMLAMMLALVLLLGWALFLEKPWLSYENVPFPTLVRQVHAGEVIPVTVRRCSTSKRSRQYDIAHAVQSLDHPNYYIMPSQHVWIEPGCTTATSLANVLPAVIPPGRYRVFGAATVEGAVRNHTVDWQSQEFEVIP